jgi:hypothetical protein
MLDSLGKTLMWIGGGLLALDLLLVLLGRIPGVGRLPGDILIRRDNVTVFIPLGTMVVVSVLLTLLLNLISRWKR